MTTQEKIQLVIDIANGQQPLSALRAAIDDGGDAQVNFVKMAVDHCVVTTKAKESGTQFRFKLTEHGTDTFTDWKPEVGRFDAVNAAQQLRREHPQAAIHVERQYV